VKLLLQFLERQLRAHPRVFRTDFGPANLTWRGTATLLTRPISRQYRGYNWCAS
jgi:hypothetical protein